MKKTFLILFVICVSTLIAFLYRREIFFSKPTAWFNTLDLDNNGLVTRPEWEYRYQETNIFAGWFREFENVDCDHDGVIAWSDYKRFKIDSGVCNKESEIAGQLSASGELDTIVKSIVLTDQEYASLNNANAKSSLFVLSEIYSQRANSYVEKHDRDFSDTYIDSNCGMEPRFEIYASYSKFSPGSYSGIQCQVTNNSGNNISLLVLNLQFARNGIVQHSDRHAKTVLIAPDSTARIHILYVEDSYEVSVDILSFATM